MSNHEPTYNDLWRNGQLRDQIDSLRDENDHLRQSLHEARELIEGLIESGVEHSARDYQVMQVPWAVIDAARKWLKRARR